LSAIAVGPAEAAAPSTFVASYGSDSNETSNCAQANPCRTLAGALAVTSPGGEVIVVDSNDIGPASITQSVSIIAPQGVYAGIRIANGSGIVITSISGSVTLRGLTFEGPGPTGTKLGTSGLVVGNFNGSLVVQGCHFSGFFPNPTGVSGGGAAIQMAGSANTKVQARLGDTVIHDSSRGVALTGNVTASISQLKLSNLSSYGLYVADQGNGETDVSVSHSEWSAPSLAGGTAFEVDAYSENAELYLDHTVMTGGGKGVYAVSKGGWAYVTVTNSTVSKTGVGLSTAGAPAQITFSGSTINANYSGVSNAAGGTLTTTGNNLFIGNGSDVSGSLTQIATQ